MKVPAGTARMPGGPWGDQRTETSSIIQFDGQPDYPFGMHAGVGVALTQGNGERAGDLFHQNFLRVG